MNLSRPSPSIVVSVVAVVLAAGGTSYAASDLAANSVSSAKIKNGQVKKADIARNAIDSARVADGKLLARDFAPGQLPAGAPGAQGPAGPAGPAGKSALSTLQRGETVRGAAASSQLVLENDSSVGIAYSTSDSLPIPAGGSLNQVDVVGHSEPAVKRCKGSFASPTAPEGVLCIYPSGLSNAVGLSGAGLSRFGFRLSWIAPNESVQTSVAATWAYTDD